MRFPGPAVSFSSQPSVNGKRSMEEKKRGCISHRIFGRHWNSCSTHALTFSDQPLSAKSYYTSAGCSAPEPTTTMQSSWQLTGFSQEAFSFTALRYARSTLPRGVCTCWPHPSPWSQMFSFPLLRTFKSSDGIVRFYCVKQKKCSFFFFFFFFNGHQLVGFWSISCLLFPTRPGEATPLLISAPDQGPRPITARASGVQR